jgi:hypothetical protein
MKKILKTTTLSAALAGLFLSAGAFAGVERQLPSPAPMNKNITILYKDPVSPTQSDAKIDLCQLRRCIEA